MFWKTIIEHFNVFDLFIVVLGVVNSTIVFGVVLAHANKLYNFFQPRSYTFGMQEATRKALEKKAVGHREMSADELLSCRKMANSFYAVFCNLITIFPLLGMLGTVRSLIPMVNQIGSLSTGLFFGALTSTFWGIVCSITGKLEDAFISPKMDDNELYMDHYFRPDAVDVRGDGE